jgi:tripartite-type tricarboxylate transporter receptor subunit TctC
VKESGYPDFFSYGWSALYVRSDTPEEAVNVLAGAMQKVFASEASGDYARRFGSELMTLGPAAMRKLETDELARFRRVADSAGIKPGKAE